VERIAENLRRDSRRWVEAHNNVVIGKIQLSDGVANHGRCTGVLIGKVRGACEGHFSARVTGDGSNVVAIGRHHDALEESRVCGRRERPGNHRLAVEGKNVFARNTATAPSGRYHRDNLAHR
jgi:hypothetical protein